MYMYVYDLHVVHVHILIITCIGAGFSANISLRAPLV